MSQASKIWRSSRCAIRFECAGRIRSAIGGTYRQIQIYVDPSKLEARNLSLTDVVKSVDSSNLILPAGESKSIRRISIFMRIASSPMPSR